MSSGATVVFNDPRRFGVMWIVGVAARPTFRRCGRSGPSRSTAVSTPRHCACVAGQENHSQGGALGSARRRRARQHLRVRSAAPARGCRRNGEPRPSSRRRARHGRAAALADAIQARAEGCHCEAPSAGWRGPLQGLRSRRPTLSASRVPGHDQAHRADRTVDVLLPGLPALGTQGDP